MTPEEDALVQGAKVGRDTGATVGFLANYFTAMGQGLARALREAGLATPSPSSSPDPDPDLLLDGNGAAWVRKNPGSNLWVRASKVDSDGRLALTRQAIEGISNGRLAEYVRRHDA